MIYKIATIHAQLILDNEYASHISCTIWYRAAHSKLKRLGNLVGLYECDDWKYVPSRGQNVRGDAFFITYCAKQKRCGFATLLNMVSYWELAYHNKNYFHCGGTGLRRSATELFDAARNYFFGEWSHWKEKNSDVWIPVVNKISSSVDCDDRNTRKARCTLTFMHLIKNLEAKKSLFFLSGKMAAIIIWQGWIAMFLNLKQFSISGLRLLQPVNVFR